MKKDETLLDHFAMNEKGNPPHGFTCEVADALPEPEAPEKPGCYIYFNRGGSAKLSEEQQADCDEYDRLTKEFNPLYTLWRMERDLIRATYWRYTVAAKMLDVRRQFADG